MVPSHPGGRARGLAAEHVVPANAVRAGPIFHASGPARELDHVRHRERAGTGGGRSSTSRSAGVIATRSCRPRGGALQGGVFSRVELGFQLAAFHDGHSADRSSHVADLHGRRWEGQGVGAGSLSGRRRQGGGAGKEMDARIWSKLTGLMARGPDSDVMLPNNGGDGALDILPGAGANADRRHSPA